MGHRTKAAREQRGLTQAQLVDLVRERFPYVRLSQQLLSQLEMGEVERSAYLVEIAVILGVNPVWLATGEGSRMIDYAGDQAIAETLRVMERMTKYQRVRTARIVRELARDTPASDEP